MPQVRGRNSPWPWRPLLSLSKLPTAKVRRNSCHYSVKNDVCDIRREFVGTNKRVNFVPPSIPQQTPPAVRVHLMQLVGRIGKRKRDLKVRK